MQTTIFLFSRLFCTEPMHQRNPLQEDHKVWTLKWIHPSLSSETKSACVSRDQAKSTHCRPPPACLGYKARGERPSVLLINSLNWFRAVCHCVQSVSVTGSRRHLYLTGTYTGIIINTTLVNVMLLTGLKVFIHFPLQQHRVLSTTWQIRDLDGCACCYKLFL